MRLQDYANQPPAPGPPVVDQISSDSARVFCAVLPTCTHASVTFIAVDTGIELLVDHRSGNKLVPSGTAGATASPRADCYKGFVVSGLSPDTEYAVAYCQKNDIDWSPYSPRTKIRTLSSDVVITGTKTREERDEELKRHAVDVDADDDASPEKPAKRGKLEKN